MRILYVVAGNLSGALGPSELERRRSILQENAGLETSVDVVDVPNGPSSIESAYEEYLAVPGTLERIREAERNGYDGAILGCFADPGLDAARELVDIPVAGPAEAAMLLACSLGHRFSIVTVLDSVVAPLRYLAHRVGVAEKLASVRSVDIPVLDLARDREGSIGRMSALAKRTVEEDGADTLVLGCMSMGFLGAHSQVSDEVGVPVVNPVQASLKFLETLIGSGLRHSKLAYPTPRKFKSSVHLAGE